MINVNGKIVSSSNLVLEENRGFLYADAVFETMRVLDDHVLFLEDHYFRLMSSMRIIRMEIPMDFTMEYFQQQILDLVKVNTSESGGFRVRFNVYRDSEGKYLPTSRKIGYLITCEPLAHALYTCDAAAYEVELYKDFYVTNHLLSNLKTNNRLINVTGSIYAHENGYANCLLLNQEKSVIETLNGNLFIVQGNQVKTPPLSDGCIKGVMRKQILELLEKHPEYEVVEQSISAFELQKADQMFMTNTIVGICPITKYRKKQYVTTLAQDLTSRINAKIRLF